MLQRISSNDHSPGHTADSSLGKSFCCYRADMQRIIKLDFSCTVVLVMVSLPTLPPHPSLIENVAQYI